jgi:dihydrodipicolinate synthase/N-acetylneuraminate lyase
MQIVKFGANSVWAVGGMGQWPLVTIEERKAIFAEWAKQVYSDHIFALVKANL